MEAKLQTFRSPGRAEVRKLNFISLAVKAGRKCRSGTSHLRKNWQSRRAERNSCYIMDSQGRAEMRKRNFTSLVVNAVWKLTSAVSLVTLPSDQRKSHVNVIISFALRQTLRVHILVNSFVNIEFAAEIVL